MADDAFKQWYVQGLQALKTADDNGKEAAADSLKAVTAPELKQLVEAGSKTADEQANHIVALLRKAGGDPNGMPNKIEEGIRAGNREVVGAAKDPEVRDASVVAAAQIALHYRIAAYGTLASTAKHLGLEDDAKTFKQMTDEIKGYDQRFTKLAEDMTNKRASASAH